jgi:hypothetical protein
MTDLTRRDPMKLCAKAGYRLLIAAAVIVLAGCGSLGPKTLDKDQLNYGSSIGQNWKNQMLANVVRLRYVDMPVFVDVGSIVSGYTLETQVSGRLGFSDSLTGGDSQGLGAGGRYTDRPTITYMPKTGDDYLRSLLEPVEPRALLALVQAGYSAELLFTWALESINGVRNYAAIGNSTRSADSEFYEFANLITELQSLGAVAFELENDPDTAHDIVFVLRQQNPSEAVREKHRRISKILHLDPDLQRYAVIYAPFQINGATLSLQTRSVLQMLFAMSGFVEVPDAMAGQAVPGYRLAPGMERPFTVQSGPDRPARSFAAVEYQDHWYWIDNTDLPSKRVFTLMLFLTTLTNDRSKDIGPVLTIPTG